MGAELADGASSRHPSRRSVAKSRLTLCDPHGLQRARLLRSSLSWGVCSNSCPSATSAGLAGLLKLAVEAPFEKRPAGELRTGFRGRPESSSRCLQRVVVSDSAACGK